MSTTKQARRTQAYTTGSSPLVPEKTGDHQRYLPFLVLLFVASGCAALIYEVVWFQLLSLTIGSSAVSMAVLLGTFMGGMCIGSLLLSKYITRAEHPLKVYGMLEGAIGIFGLLVLWGMPVVGGLYLKIAVHGMTGIFLRGIICAICLLPPTILMGATLPAIARWVENTNEGVSWLGFFYGGNIAGAVLGSLLAGFYLLRVHDMGVATYVAVAIDLAVFVVANAMSKVTTYRAPEEETPDEDAPAAKWIRPGTTPVYVTIALSGATALAAEAVWTRMLSLLLGATVYTFSLILAAFLTGLGIGSSIGASLARTSTNPRRALGICQALLACAIAWAAYSTTNFLPYWPVSPNLSLTPTYTFQIDLVRCLWVVLPGAMLWGASFPLALAAVGRDEKDSGKMVGTVYAANTVGGIVGALFGSLLLISWIGTQNAERVLMATAAISALVAFLPIGVGSTRETNPRGAYLRAFATIVIAGFMLTFARPVPPLLVGYGRWFATRLENMNDFIYMGEGVTASVAVSQLSNGVLNYHNAGKVQASSEPQDMRLQRMLGHLTTLLPPKVDNVLVIGCGAGVTAGAVSINPALKSETIAEIEPLVPKVVSKYFGAHNYNVVTNPKVHVQIDDARHYILTTDQKFDAVTSDPLDPWVKGAATLYTEEFFNVVKEHLNPGGVVTLFVQLYETGVPGVKSEVATFLKAFPNGVVFGNTNNGGGYDLVLVGQNSPEMKIDVDAVEAKLATPEYAQVAQSLREIGFENATDLFSTFAGNAQMLAPWLADAQINRDRNLRLQFLAGEGLNQYNQAAIYSQMLQYRQYPEGLFTGSPERLARIRTGQRIF